MSKLVNGILLFGLAVTPGLSATLLFTGTFATDNQVALFNFTANTLEDLTFQTYSYAGGTVNATTFPSGGFAPVAFIFDNVGDVFNVTNGSCAQVGRDAATQNCDDIFYQSAFGPGTFTLALAVDDNRPVDTAVADGFIDDGSPGFTCQEARTSGNFCDLTTALGATRTGDFAISITGADSVTQVGASEPGGMILLIAGGALTALLRRRQISHSL
jgi:hypothetical protein